MLYLEDYLEMIENLPMEMRDRLTEMREMDLQVQNAVDSLDDRVKTFFKKCLQPNIKTEMRQDEFEAIKKDYYKALEDADEKVQLGNQIYEMVERHLRKLDQELSKFKMELEADNAGITEVLEKRSLELDKPSTVGNINKAEKRKYPQHMPLLSSHTEKRASTDKVLSSLANEVARGTISSVRKAGSAASSPAISMFNSGSGPPQSAISYSLGQLGAGSNAAIAAAASQAIAATQQMQQGRRTPSMRASYDVMARTADIAKEMTFGRGSPYATPSTPAAAAPVDNTPRSQRNKKQTLKASAAAANAIQQQKELQQQLQTPPQPQPPAAAPASVALVESVEEVVEPQIVDENGQAVDWQYDPNEPRYCLCNQVSYGDMVGCDNDDCPIEWFHYGCVGLAQAPKGKWYCPQCTAAMKRRGRR
ncbi:inhibitor of growth protein 3-like [Liolophura sinensis]|uniref:inhibitor of growth protein 3-like n=1 Tax=Liolophura sinensis TaxID=3198878 RepID=UPI003158892D